MPVFLSLSMPCEPGSNILRDVNIVHFLYVPVTKHFTDAVCFSGKGRNLNIVELQCNGCLLFHHESCISLQLGKLVPFLSNYTFTCRNCSNTGLETFKKHQARECTTQTAGRGRLCRRSATLRLIMCNVRCEQRCCEIRGPTYYTFVTTAYLLLPVTSILPARAAKHTCQQHNSSL